MALPLSEIPSSFVSGDTFNVVLSLPEYTAPTWSAVLYLTAYGRDTITINSTDYGSEHLLFISGGSTPWAAGDYSWALKVVGNGILTVDTGLIRVLADPVSVTGATDTRTHAQRSLDLINAAIEGRIPSGMESYSIAGRTITKIPLRDLITLRDRYRTEVLAEQATASGRSNVKKIVVQFT